MKDGILVFLKRLLDEVGEIPKGGTKAIYISNVGKQYIEHLIDVLAKEGNREND